MAQTHQLSSSQRMANAILANLPEPTTLRDYLARARAQGLAYETISKELHTLTGGVISMSYNTVKRWLLDFDLEEAS